MSLTEKLLMHSIAINGFICIVCKCTPGQDGAVLFTILIPGKITNDSPTFTNLFEQTHDCK